jgi:VWFA-related protein
MRIRIALAAALALILSGSTVRTQEPLPQFRGGVELVKIDVTVLDGDRRPVRGLTAADFTVRDDGQVRPVRAFTPVELSAPAPPSAPVWSRSVPSDVVSNAVGDQEGRLVVIVMDRSIPLHEPTFVARRIATAAVESLGPHDLAAVVSTSNGAVQSLTADRTRLLRAIDAGDPSTGMTKEALEIMNMPPAVPLNPLSDGRCLCGVCVLDTLTRVADALQHAPLRRKVVLFIGSQIVWQTAQSTLTDIGCGNRLRDARKAMFAAVDRAHVTVHSIDPVSLAVVGPQTRAAQAGMKPNQPRTLFMTMQQDETNEALGNQDSLRVLPDRTGGRTVVNRNDPEQVVPDIYRESEAYYVLGFERGAGGRPGREHDIEVTVARKGVKVYAQRHYTAPARVTSASTPGTPPAPEAVTSALTGLLPSASRPLAVAASTFAGPDPAKSDVRLAIDVAAFLHGGAAVPLAIEVLATDPAGRALARGRQTSTVTGSSVSGEVAIASHLQLPPGEYNLRVAVSDTSTNQVASVFADVSVPRFDRAPLSMSGLVVEASGNASTEPVVTTRRAFGRGAQVRARLQIYQGTTRTDPLRAGTLRVRMLDARGTVVRDESLPFSPATFTDRRADCAVALPVAGLAAGEYLLQLDATAGNDTATQALRFSVK